MRQLLTLLIVLAGAGLRSQSNPSYTVFAGSLQGPGLTLSSNINFSSTHKANYPAPLLREKNTSARLYLKLDLGDDYIKSASNWNFKADVEITYKFGSANAVTKVLSVSNNSVEVMKIEDVLPLFTATSPAFTSTITGVHITDGSTVIPTPTLTGLVNDFVGNNLRLSAWLAREYNVDVRYDAGNHALAYEPVPVAPVVNNRLVTFSWQLNLGQDAYPNYEIQILKLYNTTNALQNDNSQISTEADWSRALKVETQSHATSLQLTIAEGTGYYLWRVRPIGTYFEGGAGNSENYGQWSYHIPDGATASLQKNTLTGNNPPVHAFYFTDPDENLNWIYNRVFTEGDAYDPANPTGAKVSEGMSYADGLLRARQSQKYNSSENTSIVSQTFNDYSGRPALVTMPVPTTGRLAGYKPDFVSSATSGSYTAKQFDDDANVYSPETISDSGSQPFGYYSGNVSTTGIDNANVPSAEGYPFKRTIYKTDGTNRVEEESGVGKTHSLGSQSNGQGRTTRVFYGTPSDDELIRIFGVEAPMAESVIKTTTIDQNNVISVSYTSKEGKTIATALSSSATANLSPLTGSLSAFTVTSQVNQNVVADGKIVASKRLSVMADNTLINMSYATNSLTDDGGGCISGGCNFELRFYLVDIRNSITYISDTDLSSSAVTNFTTSSGTILSFPAGWGFRDVKGSTLTVVPTGTASSQLTLNSGDYLFIKELYSTNPPDYAEKQANAVYDNVRTILSVISNSMQGVYNPLKRATFELWWNQLKDKIHDYNQASSSDPGLSQIILDHLCVVPNDLFMFPSALEFAIDDLTSSDGEAGSADMKITTKCCGTLTVQIPKSSVCAACYGKEEADESPVPDISTMVTANQNAAEPVTPYGITDFEANDNWSSLTEADKRDAVQDLVDREFIGMLKQKMRDEGIDSVNLWKIAPGFTYESLNFMISNMLISRYYAGSTLYHAGTWYECSKDANGNYVPGSPVISAAISSTAYPHNYDCKKLYEAWTAAVEMLGSFDLDGNDNNVIQEYDNAEGPLATLYSMLDLDNWAPALKKTIEALHDVIENKINKFKNSKAGSVPDSKIAAQTSLTGNFIDFAGHQFAAIIDGTALPGYVSTGSLTVPDDYTVYPAFTPTESIYVPMTVGSDTYSYVPVLFTNTGTVTTVDTYSCGGNEYNELYYPYILRPEWMFKYFVYNVYEPDNASPYIGDLSYVLPHQVQLDLALVYNAPVSYLSSEMAVSPNQLCQKPVVPGYTVSSTSYTFSYEHNNWSIAERNNFYGAVIGGAACPEHKGVGSSSASPAYYAGDTAPQCQTKGELYTAARAELDEVISNMTDKAANIRAALAQELESACYNIVPCKSPPPANACEITARELDMMVGQVIAQCIGTLQAIKDKFVPDDDMYSLRGCDFPGPLTQDYSTVNSCDLPACLQQSCTEIILFDENVLGLVENNTFQVKYFNDCDQKIIDMLVSGMFLPDIGSCPYAESCPSRMAKTWRGDECTTNDCSGNYGETTCPSGDYEKYSKPYTITVSSEH